MNILPNSFLTSPISAAAIAAAAAASASSSSSSASPSAIASSPSAAALLKQHQQSQAAAAAALAALTTTPPLKSLNSFKCVVCEDSLPTEAPPNDPQQQLQQHQPPLVHMLAVRPSIGSPAGPFFPILETLTSTSAVRVPCCTMCAQSLLDQWNDYELKNVSIKNRVYNLQARYPGLRGGRTQSISATGPRFLLPHSNGTSGLSTPNIGSVVALEAVTRAPSTGSSSASRESNPQDEVLDLSMPTTPKPSSAPPAPLTPCSLSPQNLTRTFSNSASQNNKVASVLPFGSSLSSRPAAPSLAQARTVSLELAASMPPQFFNSSMTNLIKVTSNPSSVKSCSPFPQPAPSSRVLLEAVGSSSNHHSSSACSSPSPCSSQQQQPSSVKKPLYSCSLCDDSCVQLLSVFLRPQGNCPYFPTLIPHVSKAAQSDPSGRIVVCQSCHRQLFQQWEEFQMLNKPITERFYQLVRPITKTPNSVFSSNFPLHQVTTTTDQPHQVTTNSVITSNSGALIRSTSATSSHIPPISLHQHQQSQSASASVGPAHQTAASQISKHLFYCVICNRDLLYCAAQVAHGVVPHSSNQYLGYSMLTEPDPAPVISAVGVTSVKKLVVHSAQEINLMPFLPSNNNQLTPASQHQLIALVESGRLLACHSCFDTITSRTTFSSSSQNSVSNNNVLSNSGVRSLRDSLNGNLKSSHVESSSCHTDSTTSPSDLCLGCQYNKAQRLVETKESSSKDPFFPFLRDPNEPLGRAKICGACHLMLETQWDAFEAGYVPYAQRTYRLPSASSVSSSSAQSSNSNLVLSKRPSTNAILSSSSSPVVLSQHSHPNGQPTPPPLKIQISSPSIVVPSTLTNSENCQLLLTTVNNSTPTSALLSSHPLQQSALSSSGSVDNERIFHLINEFLAKLNGPLPVTTCSCTICQESIGNNEAYQVFSTSQKILISPELGLYPYFPMLRGMGVTNTKKLKVDNTHVVCTFCYHSLIAQWAAYHLSTYPEDRDPNNRNYNLRDFICYVCGVTTYRQLVRSITVKDFPFLMEHKRPPGALSLHSGDSVITCLNCFDTLTHQWIENERMKVPLEMRQYNWMPVPQPPPPSTTPSSSSNCPNNKDNDTKSQHSDHSSRSTPVSVVSSTGTIPASHLAILNHNGLASGAALTLVTKSISTFPYQAILTTTTTSNPNDGNCTTTVPSIVRQPSLSGTTTPVVTFNPSHTLAPLVAAAMAATPVVTNKDNATNSQNSESMTNGTAASSTGNNNSQSIVNTNSFADALRHLARQQTQAAAAAAQIKSEPSTPTIQLINSANHVNHHHHLSSASLSSPSTPAATATNHSSINLSTLASVAALAGNHRTENHHHVVTTNHGHAVDNHNHQAVASAAPHPNHAFVLNLASLQSDIKYHPSLPFNHPDHPKYILASTALATDHNRQFVLNNANGGNVIIQFAGAAPGGAPPKASLHNHTHHAHHLPLAVHKNLHHPLVSAEVRNHHSKRNSLTKVSNRLLVPVRPTDSPEHNNNNNKRSHDDTPEISHYDKCLSKVGLKETKLRHKRHRGPPKQLSRHDNSDMSGDDELEIVEDEIEEMEMHGDGDDDEDSTESLLDLNESDETSSESLLRFVESVLPPLAVEDNPEKMSFLTQFGLTTKKAVHEEEFIRYIHSKLHHRISHLSFQLAMLDEDDYLEAEEQLKLCTLESSDVMPNSVQLADRLVEKGEFMQALNLTPSEDDDAQLVIERELVWLAVVQDRLIRRKRGDGCLTQYLHNNLTNGVLSQWLPHLLTRIREHKRDPNSTRTPSPNELKLANSIQPLLNLNLLDRQLEDEKKHEAELNASQNTGAHANKTIRKRSLDHSTCLVATDPTTTKSSTSSSTKPNCDNQSSPQPHPQMPSNSQQQQQATATTPNHQLPTSKLINSKQFAQEFYDSLWKETKQKEATKAASTSTSSTAVVANHHGPNSTNSTPSDISMNVQMVHNHSTQHNNAQYAHQLIFSGDALRPGSTVEGAAQMVNSAPPGSVTIFKFPDQIGVIREQIMKLQQRISQIDQEKLHLNEKRNEIDTTLHKLDDEESTCKVELDKLAKCIENSII